jgi:hypothetical protein
MTNEQGASSTPEEAPASRSPAQTPAEAVYDEVMLGWFKTGSVDFLPQELVLDAAVSLVAPRPNYRQLGVASAFLVMLAAERDQLLQLINRAGLILVKTENQGEGS